MQNNVITIKRSVLILSLATSVCCSPSQPNQNISPLKAESSWSGPAAFITKDMKIKIGEHLLPPFFLSINPQAVTSDADWTTLIYQVDLALKHNLVILDVMFSNESEEFMQILNAKLGTRRVFIFVRIYFGEPADDVTDAWVETYIKKLQLFISKLNKNMSDKVIGIRAMGLNGGEWFQIPSDPSFAKKVANAQLKINAAIKTLSSGRLLTIVNSGYLLAMSAVQGGSHVYFEEILNSPDIDIISSPYEYGISRQVDQPFLQQVPFDSVPLHGKLFLTEDDTRTSRAQIDPWKSCFTAECDITMVNRNVQAALDHNTGLYFLDLTAKGWFGSPSAPVDSENLWNAIDTAIHKTPNLKVPQIGFFADEGSMRGLKPLTQSTEAATKIDFIGMDNLNYEYQSCENQILSLEKNNMGVRYFILADKQRAPRFNQEAFLK